MKTLEGEAAISYLDRLHNTLSRSDSAVNIYSHARLLKTIFRIEHAYLATIQPESSNSDQVRLTITSSGFPSIPSTLTHLKRALELHFSQVTQKKSLAINWIDSVMGLDESQITTTNQKLSKNENPYPKISAAINNLSNEQINFLRKSTKSTRGLWGSFNFPALETNDSNWPGLLLVLTIDHTPFFPPSEIYDAGKALELGKFGRKYLDSTAAQPESDLGDKDHPFDLKKNADAFYSPTLIVCQINGKSIIKDSIRVWSLPTFGWIKLEPNDDFPQHRQITAPIRIDYITSLSSPELLRTLLNIDFSGLSDKSTNAIIKDIPEIKRRVDETIGYATLYAKNGLSASTERQESALKLIKSLDRVEDSEARAAIKLAVWRQLTKSKEELAKLPSD